jgi:tRNA threonylcarbamoyladenosine biosynthesis protein TsaB
MWTLALDTTTRAGSAALVDGRHVVAERAGDGSRSHGERLPGELAALLDACGAALADVGLFAVAAGPGSFTGLRIGISTMQGLAFVARRPLVAVSALDAAAHAAAASLDAGALVGVWLDAARGDVFSALYRVTDAARFTPERLAVVEAAAVGAPADAASRWYGRDGPPVVVGDGAARFHDALDAAAPWPVRIVDRPPLAGVIGLLAGELAARGQGADPRAVRPLYVRRPDAVIARDGGTASHEAVREPGRAAR